MVALGCFLIQSSLSLSALPIHSQSTWVAGFNEKFRHWTLIEAARLCGVRSMTPDGSVPIKTHNVDPKAIPTEVQREKERRESTVEDEQKY